VTAIAIAISILERCGKGVAESRWNAVLTGEYESSISVVTEILDFAVGNQRCEVNVGMNPSMQTSAGHNSERSTPYETRVQDSLTVLVVSADLESRRSVTKTLEALSVHVIPCSTLTQAEQVLSFQRPHLIFCDERLPDGGYADLLELKDPGRIPPPIVVLTRNGEWELYMDATRRGAFDVIRSPWCPTDIELSLIRGAREERHSTYRTIR
jgi:CheY-like chemotaxis protein